MGTGDETAREAQFFQDAVDPYARQILETDDPWVAYESVVDMRGGMLDYLEWGSFGGRVFTAWADLEDVYETGKTPPSDAHAALVRAATMWLARPTRDEDVPGHVARWLIEAERLATELFKRDGDFWPPPS